MLAGLLNLLGCISNLFLHGPTTNRTKHHCQKDNILNQGRRRLRRGNLVSAWKFSFGVETSKIGEFLKEIKETCVVPAGLGSQ